MNVKRVIVIDEPIHYHMDINLESTKKKKRVCAYARVSTDTEDQLNSYKVQIEEYTKRINQNPDWEFQGMYADEGISGTSMKKRVQFQKMIDEARKGNIDLILTKSLSRFARNTVDCLTIIREMREINVEVYFEKENLYSSDPKVDFLLTIFSSIAQEEARNISENIKWGKRKRYKEGKVYINTSRFLGYDKDEEGNIVINDKQAQVVKMIFNLYLDGLSAREIAKHLTDNNIENGRGVVHWAPATITGILTNEKYCGDAILQKRVTTDYLTHKSVKNNGIAPKYYIMNNHEAIIPRETFELVQRLKKDRSKQASSSRYKNQFPLSGMVYCCKCHRVLNRHYYHPNTKYERIVLNCKNTSRRKFGCDTKPIDNKTLEGACTDAIYKITKSRPELIDEILEQINTHMSLDHIGIRANETKKEITKLEDEIKELINMRIRNTVNQDDQYFQDVFEQKKNKIASLKKELDKLNKMMVSSHIKQERLDKIKDYITNFNHLSHDVLEAIFTKIISINSEEVIFCISKVNYDNETFINSIDSLINYDSLFESTYTDEKTKRSIQYKIIEFGDEINGD
jgi:site-specific DNA recombinase